LRGVVADARDRQDHRYRLVSKDTGSSKRGWEHLQNPSLPAGRSYPIALCPFAALAIEQDFGVRW